MTRALDDQEEDCDKSLLRNRATPATNQNQCRRTTIYERGRSRGRTHTADIRLNRTGVVTGQREFIQAAHLCPKAENDWYKENGMRAYANRPPDQITENSTNDAISLRDDIGRAFDSAFFVIVRKQGRWVAHFWKRTVEIGRMYHNCLLNIHPAVHPCFLLARFAWSLFPLLSSFVQEKQKRRIRVYTTVEGEQEDIEANEGDILNIIKDKAQSETSTSLRKRVCDGGPQSDSGLASTSSVVPHNVNPFAMGAQEYARTWELRKRPSDPNLICCDYDEADKAATQGKDVSKYLCSQCLGVEARDEVMEELEFDPWVIVG
ncbi:hypothetical protein V8E54_011434 [Elaphomyces granulatus]